MGILACIKLKLFILIANKLTWRIFARIDRIAAPLFDESSSCSFLNLPEKCEEKMEYTSENVKFPTLQASGPLHDFE